MNPGRELAALVAEKVMGWTIVPSRGRTAAYYDPSGYWVGNWRPDRDIAAAWMVVEKMHAGRALHRAIQLSVALKPDGSPYYWRCSFGLDEHIKADTAPHAICLAALKAVGVEVEPQP